MGRGEKRRRNLDVEELADLVAANLSAGIAAARFGHERVRKMVKELSGLIEATSPGPDGARKQGGASMLISGRASSGREVVVREALHNAREKLEGVEVIDVWLDGVIHQEDPTRALARRLECDFDTENVLDVRPLTVPQAMSRIRKNLQAASPEEPARAKLYVFVLSHFELFVSKSGVDQSFLYSLLDIIQGDRIPGMLVGLTERADAEDLLEKRIKSRFSHRVRLMPRPVSDNSELMLLVKAWLQPPPKESFDGKTHYTKSVSDFLKDAEVQRCVERAWQRDGTLGVLEIALHTVLLPLCRLAWTPSRERQSAVSSVAKRLSSIVNFSNGITTRKEILKRVSRSEIIIMGTLSKLYSMRNKPHSLHNVLSYFNDQRTCGGIPGPSEALALKSLDVLLALELVAFSDLVASTITGPAAAPKSHRSLILTFQASELVEAVRARQDLTTEDERLILGQWAH